MADDPTSEPALDVNSLSFEQAFQRLGELAESLDAGGLTLADATARYEQGMVLVQRCNQLLNAAELKITSLKDSYSQGTNGQDSHDAQGPGDSNGQEDDDSPREGLLL
ncbi:MAG: exodeoxyribonuclease VII small subunit [SAR202 cluster bacterium Io17-Chloro-G9]|nr:MAG: exodeoxyribonuclease VII small subunit [SAR202 cluster bacterium Io17-Chloro-G9]